MAKHAFKVGQRVRLSASSVSAGVAGIYKILALLPEERGDRQYRVQNTANSQQRVVTEANLTAITTY